MSYLGNSPQISVARTVTDKTVTDETQSLFGSLGGYTPGMVDVYVNGVLLSDEDYAATDGSTIVLNEPAVLGDKLRVISFIPNADINTGYVKRLGDTMIGSLTGITNLGTDTITLDHTQQSSNTLTTTSNTQVIIDSFSSSTFRSAKYFVQMTSGSDYHATELSLIQDGTDAPFVQYGDNFTDVSLGTFASNISGGNVNLLITPTNAITTIKLHRTTINI